MRARKNRRARKPWSDFETDTGRTEGWTEFFFSFKNIDNYAFYGESTNGKKDVAAIIFLVVELGRAAETRIFLTFEAFQLT